MATARSAAVTTASSDNQSSPTDHSSNTAPDGSLVAVNDLQLEVQQCRDLLAEKDAALQKRERCISDMESSAKEIAAELEAERRNCCDVAARLRNSEELLSSRTAELLAMKKQCESLTFELQSCSSRQSELVAERDSLRQRSQSLAAELHSLQATHSQLMATACSREFELNAFREQIASMQRLTETSQTASRDGEQRDEELKVLSNQLEGTRQQAMSLQHERDQACLALQQQQAECTQLKHEVSLFSLGLISECVFCVFFTRTSLFSLFFFVLHVFSRSFCIWLSVSMQVIDWKDSSLK